MSQQVIHVHIGEIVVSKKVETLKSIMGSCVAILMIWRKNNICALAHCLLPECPKPNSKIGGRFVDQAIQSMLHLLHVDSNQLEELEVVLAGGGNMNASTKKHPNSALIGDENAKVALRELKKLGIKIIYQDLGGFEGRRITVDTKDFSFIVEKIPTIPEQAS